MRKGGVMMLNPNNTTEYRGYYIDYNIYGKNEFTVQCDGDDYWFNTIKEAMDFIDSIT